MQAKSRVSFLNQGCRLNASETATLESIFSNNGYDVVPTGTQTEICVVNTCTVTENSDKDTRRLVNRLVRENPDVKIALIGCLSQVKKEALSELPNVRWIVGNQAKMDLLSVIESSRPNSEPEIHVPKFSPELFTQPTAERDRHHCRANLKIQDGCDNYCSFCIIPFARGPARSRLLSDILTEAQSLVRSGHQELVLTGVNIGTYQDGPFRFEHVVEKLTEIEGIKRLRISSIEPLTIPNRVLELIQNKTVLTPYFHIPIQAGDDQILSTMRRRYSIDEYVSGIRSILDRVPLACIGTDIITGFPGETDEHHANTMAVLSDLPLAYFHVFSYSERSLAHSRKFNNKVPSNIIKRRSEELRRLSATKRFTYQSKFIGQTLDVLFEQRKKDHWIGLTENFIKVRVLSSTDLTNRILPVKLTACNSEFMDGYLL